MLTERIGFTLAKSIHNILGNDKRLVRHGVNDYVFVVNSRLGFLLAYSL